LGDVVKIKDESQTVVAQYTYDPWGNVLEETGTFATKQPFRYASYYLDQETKMYYLINRYYEPKIARFISKDPADDPEDIAQEPKESNPYAYAGNNPVMAVDPDGLNPTLSRGSSGDYVKLLQTILIKIAKANHKEFEPNYIEIMAPYGADGIFGVKTEQAVKAFQSVHLYKPGEKLVVDGIVGPKTWGALDWWNNNPSGINGHNDFYDERTGVVTRSFQDHFEWAQKHYPLPDKVEFGYPGKTYLYAKSTRVWNGVNLYVGRIPNSRLSGFDVENPHLHDFRVNLLKAALAGRMVLMNFVFDTGNVVFPIWPPSPDAPSIITKSLNSAKSLFFMARAWEKNHGHYVRNFRHIWD